MRQHLPLARRISLTVKAESMLPIRPEAVSGAEQPTFNVNFGFRTG
jgi:hypothetical protein